MSNRFWGHVLKCLRMPPGHKWSQKNHYPAPTLYPALLQDMVPVARKEEWVVSASPLFTYFMWISDLQQCTRLHQAYSQCFRTQKGRWKQLCSVAAAQRVEWCQHGDRQEDIWAWGQKTPQLVTQISSLPRLMTCFWNFIQDVDKLANQWPFCGVFWSFRTLFLTRFCLKDKTTSCCRGSIKLKHHCTMKALCPEGNVTTGHIPQVFVSFASPVFSALAWGLNSEHSHAFGKENTRQIKHWFKWFFFFLIIK